MEACLQHKCLKRIVNVSSFAVYTNTCKKQARVLDETCPVESRPELRGDAYCFAKVNQEAIAAYYGNRFEVPCVTVRPGVVYGPGNLAITGRVGIDSFGLFLHLGGSNRIPLTYVDNCAEAIVLAGLTRGIDGEIFNIVDDDVPTSREFLRKYKQHVRRFCSLYVPRFLSYGLCYLWERYYHWSGGQLPNTYNRKKWHSLWKKTQYSNRKLKDKLGWRQTVPTTEGLRSYFDACRTREQDA
jgi:nucleoside-diphosphate-sugar epimerase